VVFLVNPAKSIPSSNTSPEYIAKNAIDVYRTYFPETVVEQLSKYKVRNVLGFNLL